MCESFTFIQEHLCEQLIQFLVWSCSYAHIGLFHHCKHVHRNSAHWLACHFNTTTKKKEINKHLSVCLGKCSIWHFYFSCVKCVKCTLTVSQTGFVMEKITLDIFLCYYVLHFVQDKSNWYLGSCLVAFFFFLWYLWTVTCAGSILRALYDLEAGCSHPCFRGTAEASLVLNFD